MVLVKVSNQQAHHCAQRQRPSCRSATMKDGKDMDPWFFSFCINEYFGTWLLISWIISFYINNFLINNWLLSWFFYGTLTGRMGINSLLMIGTLVSPIIFKDCTRFLVSYADWSLRSSFAGSLHNYIHHVMIHSFTFKFVVYLIFSSLDLIQAVTSELFFSF